jgi:hypothetical protein
MHATLVVLLGLAGVCVYSVFLDSDDLRAELMNTTAMAVVWGVLGGGLLVGAAMIRNARRNWPTILAHLGGAMILAAAMISSKAGINLLNDTIRKDNPIIRDAQMQLVPKAFMSNAATGDLYWSDEAGKTKLVGLLPGFKLRCNSARMDYYSAKNDRWRFVLEMAETSSEGEKQRTQTTLPNDGRFATIRFPGVEQEWECALVEYLDPNSVEKATLVIAHPQGKIIKTTISKYPTILVDEDGLEVREITAYSHLGKMADGTFAEAKSAPGRPALWNPASEVEFSREGTPPYRAMVHNPANAVLLRGQQNNIPLVMVLRPRPEEVLANRLGEPAARIVFRRKEDKQEWSNWIAARVGEDSAVIPFAIAFQSEKEFESAGSPLLALVRNQSIKRYVADVSVLDPNGKELARHELILNYPFRHGGYEFSLQYFAEDEVPIIRVSTTMGLDAIYLGYVLLVGGLFGGMWILPLWRWSRRGPKEDTA